MSAPQVVGAQGDVILQDVSGKTGAEQLADIQERMYGGKGKGRTSFRATLYRKRGNIILSAIPVSIVGAILAGVLVLLRTADPDLWFLPELQHPFVVQILSIILSFVIVARSQVAMQRYFQGAEHVHTMSTRWIDSFTSLLGFLRSSSDLHPKGSPKQQACVALGLAMLHWGSLAHALAINSLQMTQMGIDESIWQHRITILDPPENLELDGGRDSQAMQATRKTSVHKTRAGITKDAVIGEKQVQIVDGKATGVEIQGAKRELVKLGVYGAPSMEETMRLHGATDKVCIVLMWMEEAISRAQVQGILLTAPPILGRAYNELGSGLAGFNSAYRIALVPFPFCFNQMIAWNLAIFLIVCPMVSYVFTGGEALTSSLTFCCLMGFWGVNRISMELENPFGIEVNHLPMAELHHAYVEALGEMHQHPMPEYAWDSAVMGEEAKDMPTLKRALLS